MRSSLTKKLLNKARPIDNQSQNQNPNLRPVREDQQSRLLDLLHQQDQKAYKKKRQSLIKLNAEKTVKKRDDGAFEHLMERMKYCEQKSRDKKKLLISQWEKEEFKECTFTPTVRRKDEKGDKDIQRGDLNRGMQHSSENLNEKQADQSCMSRASSVIKHSPIQPEEPLKKSKTRHRNCQSFHEIRRNSDLKITGVEPSKPKDPNQSSDRLSKDLKRRQSLHPPTSTSTPASPFTSAQSHQSFLSKFTRQFESCFESLDHSLHTHLMPGQCFLSFDEFKIVMETLKYIRYFNTLGTEDVAKLGDMWEVMGGCEFAGVSKEKLRRGLMAVEGVVGDEVRRRDKGDRDKNRVTFANMNWQDQDDLICFRNQFKNFVNNKKSNMEIGQAKGEEYSFRPEILKCSARLAQKHRKRFFDNQHGLKKKRKSNDENSLTSFFQLHQKEIERKNSIKKVAKAEQQIKKCTFKPQISHNHKSSKHVLMKSQLNSSKDSLEPIFSMQVNLKDQKIDQIFIYQNDTPQTVLYTLKQRYNLTPSQESNFLKIISENLIRIQNP